MGTVWKRGEIWYIDFRYRGRRIVRSIGPSKKEAEKTLREIKKGIKESRFIPPSKPSQVRFFQIADDFLRYAKLNKNPSGYQRDCFIIRHFKAFFGDIPVGQITPDLVEKYKEKRKKKSQASTINLELDRLKTIFNQAIEKGKTSINPTGELSSLRSLT